MSEEQPDEVTANVERAQDSLVAARTLIDSEHHDVAASRCYYAVFYASTAALLSRDIRFAKHSGVINGIHRHFVREGRLSTAKGRNLNWLYELRVIGDYGETRHVPREEAERALETASALVADLIRLASSTDD